MDPEGGMSQKIQNGTDLDAAVRLVTASLPRKTFWIVYVKTREETVVSGIAAGAYLLRFALGQDWKATARRFLKKACFYQAGKQFEFTETEPTEDEPGKYTELRVTLHEVPGGNLPRVEISEAAFNEGDQGQ
jgi:hypothetical protein